VLLRGDLTGELHFPNCLLFGVIGNVLGLLVDLLFGGCVLFLQTAVRLLQPSETLHDVLELLKFVRVILLHCLEERFIVLQLLHFLVDDDGLVLQLLQFVFFFCDLVQLLCDLLAHLNGGLQIFLLLLLLLLEVVREFNQVVLD
jgi:hypothetical protein